MSTLSLIPFGLRLSDQQFVDVSDVKRGGKCDCICPSCKTPLIARQGEVNDWHFAHASKGVFSDTEKECEYSFWLSVTLMAKQVIKSAHSIKLPPLTMYTNEAIEVKVSEQTEVLLDQIEIEQKINSISVDATLKLGKYLIAIIFTTPHSYGDDYTSIIAGSDNIGILEITLIDAVEWLFGSNNQGKYVEILKSNILSNNNCKKWLFHPRQSIIENHNNISLNERCPTISPQYVPTIHSVEEKQYKCIKCNNYWYGTHQCNNCKTHLYSLEQL